MSSIPKTPLVWPSVDDLQPDEEGGPAARIGFNYQDEIAAGFFIEMLSDPSCVKIHCETHDDILIVRFVDGERTAEYVQVKGSEMDKLWSVADLCYREKGEGSSIFEKSLSRDRHDESSLFRIVTHRPVVSGLKVLSYDRGAIGREQNAGPVVDLLAAVEKRFSGAKSPKGNNAQFWIDRCYWDVRHDLASITKANILALLILSAKENCFLLPEQVEVLYTELLQWAKKAGAAKWVPDRDEKIVTREALRSWWEKRSHEIRDGADTAGGGKLTGKLRDAKISEEVIALAVEMRRDYSAKVRTSRYMEDSQIEALQQRVKSEMMMLRAKYTAGQIDIDGPAFLALCLEKLQALNAARLLSEEDQGAFLIGCMYDITDRCLHRFSRPAR